MSQVINTKQTEPITWEQIIQTVLDANTTMDFLPSAAYLTVDYLGGEEDKKQILSWADNDCNKIYSNAFDGKPCDFSQCLSQFSSWQELKNFTIKLTLRYEIALEYNNKTERTRQ